MIPTATLPFKTALGLNYDCGDFPANHGEGAGARRLAPASPRAATRRKARGKLRGIGIANPIEKRGRRRARNSPKSAFTRAATRPC